MRSIGFCLFVLVNATLFIRPAELLPALEGLPIYNVLITTCLAVSFGPVLSQLKALRERPITACVLGLLVTIVLSDLARFEFGSASSNGFDFGKVVLYYLLLLAALNSPGRLRSFLSWLVVFILILAGLALLHYHGVINLPALEALARGDDEAEGVVLQLQGTGIYNDPNDLCLILIVGSMTSLYRLTDRRRDPVRLVWAFSFCIFIYSLIMTKSRGGFLGLLASLFALLVSALGWRRAFLTSLIVLPALFLLSGGRQTRISTGEGTAQQRIKLWGEGLALIKQSPRHAVLGIGASRYADEAGLVAHNSFVHAFTELGFVGGALFLGLFCIPLRSLHRVGLHPAAVPDPGLSHLRPFLTAIVAGVAVGMMSLSRCYIVPTYMVVGLAAAYTRVGVLSPAGIVPRFDARLVGRLALLSIAFLMATSAVVRIFAEWG
jgi:hypothetical protein